MSSLNKEIAYRLIITHLSANYKIFFHNCGYFFIFLRSAAQNDRIFAPLPCSFRHDDYLT